MGRFVSGSLASGAPVGGGRTPFPGRTSPAGVGVLRSSGVSPRRLGGAQEANAGLGCLGCGAERRRVSASRGPAVGDVSAGWVCLSVDVCDGFAQPGCDGPGPRCVGCANSSQTFLVAPGSVVGGRFMIGPVCTLPSRPHHRPRSSSPDRPAQPASAQPGHAPGPMADIPRERTSRPSVMSQSRTSSHGSARCR